MDTSKGKAEDEQVNKLDETQAETLKELEELRQYKAQREQEQQFQELVKEIEPYYIKANGRKGHTERFVREYQSQLTDDKNKDYEAFLKETSKKDNLFFDKPKPVNTSSFFGNNTQTKNSQEQNPTETAKDEIEKYFRKSSSGTYSTIRKR